MKKNIIFTGGGSGGHLMPAISLILKLEKINDFNISYIGGRNGIERKEINKLGIKYYPVFTGKLRRYLSVENFIDLFKVFIGLIQSVIILSFYKSKNTLIFSTGGFVSVPVVIAGWIIRKKIFIHEQTSRVGLANKICSRFATKIFVSFSDSLQFFPKGKTILSGNPLREEVYKTSVLKIIIDGIVINDIKRPVLFVTGGGNGALILNELIKRNLMELEKKYFIVHQVGKKFIDEYRLLKSENYLPVEFVDQIIDLFKIAEVIISRAGAGTVCELISLRKKSIFVPLKIAQKNEQYHNAMAAQKELGSIVLNEDDLLRIDLIGMLDEVKKSNTDSLMKNDVLKASDIIITSIVQYFS